MYPPKEPIQPYLSNRSDWQKELNKLPLHQRIVAYEKMHGKQNYIIVDKKRGVIKVMSPLGEELWVAPVGLGAGALRAEYKGKTDVLLKNIAKPTSEEQYNFLKDNDITSAGVFTAGEYGGQGNKAYGGQTIVLKDGKGKNLGMLIHQVPNMPERDAALNRMEQDIAAGKSPNPKDMYMSNGCINLRVQDYKKISKYTQLGSRIYVLPDSKDVDIKITEGKPGLTVLGPTKTNIQGKDVTLEYNTNKSWLKSTYGIKQQTPEIGKSSMGKQSGDNYTKRDEFINGINKHADSIKKIYGLNQDVADEIAKASYGIAGNETKWGTDYGRYAGVINKEDAYKGEGMMGVLGLNNQALSGLQEWKRNRGLLGMIKDVFTGQGEGQLAYNTAKATPSHGITQMKYAPENSKFLEYFNDQYKLYNNSMPSNRNLVNKAMLESGYNPEQSAALTMARLAENYNNLNNQFGKARDRMITRDAPSLSSVNDLILSNTAMRTNSIFGGASRNLASAFLNNSSIPVAMNGIEHIVAKENMAPNPLDYLMYTWQNPGQIKQGTATPDKNIYRKQAIANANDFNIVSTPVATVTTPKINPYNRIL